MRFFLSGVIQGSSRGVAITDQSYRDELKSLLRSTFPQPAHVTLCPIEMYPYSTELEPEAAKRAFEHLVESAATADAIVAYLPTASNGTAIEIWEAHKRGTPVFSISPMTENWVIKFYSTRVFPDVAAFAQFVHSGELAAFMQQHLHDRQTTTSDEIDVMEQ